MAKLEDKRQQPALWVPVGRGSLWAGGPYGQGVPVGRGGSLRWDRPPVPGCLTPCQGTAHLAVLQEGQRGSCLLVGTGLRSGGCHQLCTTQGDSRF